MVTVAYFKFLLDERGIRLEEWDEESRKAKNIQTFEVSSRFISDLSSKQLILSIKDSIIVGLHLFRGNH